MPNYYCFSCLLIFVFLSGSCKQKNTLAQDEIRIVNELATLEAITENQIAQPTTGTYLDIPEEPRNPDPSQQIAVLDILKARSDVRDIKVTDLFTEIRYVPIKFPESNDSISSMFGEYNFLITPSNIIASHFTDGISQFDLNGNFLDLIVKNDFYFTSIPGRSLVMVTRDDMKQFVGNSGKVHAIGDRIYYQYHDNPEGHGAMMMYDTDPRNLSPMMVSPTDESRGKPKGSEIYPFPISDPKFGAISSIESFNAFPISEDEWATTNSVMNSSRSGNFLYTTNLNGDTLTKFTDHDPIKNFTGGNYRSLDSRGDQYSFNGIQHVRQSHNDTIYIISKSNKLYPKYVLDFGEKGIQSSMEAIDPRQSLKEKYIINDFIESNKYLFISYTQNAPSPNAAKNNEIFYNACIYNKNTKELFHIYIDKLPHIPKGSRWPAHPIEYLRNNQGNRPAFWPKKTTYDGKPFTWIKRSDAPENLSNNNFDYLLMIAY